jgi:hypothetical protein
MAEIEKTEFEFPDEKEVDLKKGGEVELQAEPEIEVVDDTPEADRGRKPMVEPPKEFAEDELTKYDERAYRSGLSTLPRDTTKNGGLKKLLNVNGKRLCALRSPWRMRINA